MKPLQGNLDFFLIRASRGAFRLKHKTQGPSHIHIPKGKLLLKCLWKDGLPLQSKTGNQLSSPDDIGCPYLSSCCFTEIDAPIELRWVSQGFLDCCKGCQATCCICCGMRDGYGFNEGEMCFILSWFGVHQSILHSWGDLRVLLLLWKCSWWFSSVASGKSRFLTPLIGNMELLSMKCRGIGAHLAAAGKSQEFSRVGACTWCIFSSYGGDGNLKLGFVQRRQDSCLVMTDTSGS